MPEVTATPKHVIQVFENVVFYGKDEKQPEIRTRLTSWKETLLSDSGFGADETLFVNEAVLNPALHFTDTDLVILHDYHNPPPAWTSSSRPSYALFKGLHLSLHFELFRLTYSDNFFNLHLNYSGHSYRIGVPRRADYKLAELKLNQPVRVSLNSKSDYERHARTYGHFEYVFVYYGLVTRFEVQSASELTLLKPVPIDEAKHINLLKVLY
jgi:hypothetical protein